MRLGDQQGASRSRSQLTQVADGPPIQPAFCPKDGALCTGWTSILSLCGEDRTTSSALQRYEILKQADACFPNVEISDPNLMVCNARWDSPQASRSAADRRREAAMPLSSAMTPA